MRWVYGLCVLLWWGWTRGTIYTVTTPADDGSTGTLRWAIQQANQHGGMDTIYFTIANDTIVLTDTLPTIREPLLIDGQSQNITLDGSNASVSWVFQVRIWDNLVPLQIRNLQLIKLAGYGVRVQLGSTSALDSVVVELKKVYFQGAPSNIYNAVYLTNYGIMRLTMDSCVVDTFAGDAVYLVNNNNSTTERFHAFLRGTVIRNCTGHGIHATSWREDHPIDLRIEGGRLEFNGNADYEAAVYAHNEVRLYMQGVHLRQNATHVYLDANGYSQYDTLIACRLDTANYGTRMAIVVSQPSTSDSLVLYMEGDTLHSVNSAESHGLLILKAAVPTWIHVKSCVLKGGYGITAPDWGWNDITTLDSVLVEDSRFVNGTYGIYLTHDGADRLEVRRCVISGHQYHGVYVNGDIDSLVFVDDTLENNGASSDYGEGVEIADANADFNTFSRCIVRGNLGLAYNWVSGANEGWTSDDGQLPSVTAYTVFRTAGSVDSLVIEGTGAPANGQVEAYFVDTLDEDPSGYGELTGYLSDPTADASGNFRIVVYPPLPSGWDTTDLVTVVSRTPGGSTSEVGPNRQPILVQEGSGFARTASWRMTTVGRQVVLLRAPGAQPEEVPIEVYTIEGRRIYKAILPAAVTQWVSPRLSSGVYLIRLRTPERLWVNKALVLP